MNLTNAEKLILVMLSEIQVKLGMDTADAKFITRAIHTGNEWALSWQFTGIVGSEPDPTPPIVHEVHDMLGMWDDLERAYNSFDQATKDKISQEAGLPGYGVKFIGFDDHTESKHGSVASFFTKHMDQFPGFQGRSSKAPSPMVTGYRRMLEVYRPIRERESFNSLSPSNVVEIMKVRRG